MERAGEADTRRAAFYPLFFISGAMQANMYPCDLKGKVQTSCLKSARLRSLKLTHFSCDSRQFHGFHDRNSPSKTALKNSVKGPFQILSTQS